MAIDVKINGKNETYESEITIMQLLNEKKVRPEIVAVELNGELVQKGQYEEIKLQSGDQIEYLLYMAGGSLTYSFANL